MNETAAWWLIQQELIWAKLLHHQGNMYLDNFDSWIDFYHNNHYQLQLDNFRIHKKDHPYIDHQKCKVLHQLQMKSMH